MCVVDPSFYERINMYIREIERVFLIKYGEDIYKKIQYFKEQYLKELTIHEDKIFLGDFMDHQHYDSFIRALALAYDSDFFAAPYEQFQQDSSKFILSILPKDSHDE